MKSIEITIRLIMELCAGFGSLFIILGFLEPLYFIPAVVTFVIYIWQKINLDKLKETLEAHPKILNKAKRTKRKSATVTQKLS